MAVQTVFERFELKFMLTFDQKEKILRVMEPYMKLDQYGRTTIRNLYYDTDDYRLVRKSIERPVYKEKLRVRSYDRASPDSTVFVELKKKYHSTVYKRRLPLTEQTAMAWLSGKSPPQEQSQIAKEIEYFRDFYQTLKPAAFLSYEREAYYALDGSDFRITFDDTILFREDELSLQAKPWGTPLLEEGNVLMELKCSGGVPLWLTRFLTRERIFKTSFSKYGTGYQRIIYPRLQEEANYVQSVI